MLRRTTSILAIKSASLLCPGNARCCSPPYSNTKRCSAHDNVVCGIKGFPLSTALSTAIEGNIDSSLGPNGERQHDANPGGLFAQQHQADGQEGAAGGEFRVRRLDGFYQGETPNGDYTGKATGLGQMPRGYEGGGYGSSNWNQDPYPCAATMGVPNEVTSGYGCAQDAIRNYRMERREERQQTPQASGHQVSYHKLQNGYCAEDRPDFHQGMVGDWCGSGQNQNFNHRAHPREVFQQQPRTFHNSIECQQRPNGFDAEKPLDYSRDRYFRQANEATYSPVEFHQRSGGSCKDKSHEFQPTLGEHSTATNDIGKFEGDLQQTLEVSYNRTEYQEKTNGYLGKFTEFQSKSREYYRENGAQPSLSLMGNDTENKPLIEDADEVEYRGTLDELDISCKKGKMDEAVKVLDLLEKQGIAVDLPRYLQLFQICGGTKSLEEARAIHEHAFRVIQKVEINVCNKILDMYARCGSMEDACKLFETMPARNLTSWDTMIMGFANNGLGEDAIDMFTQFKQRGLVPDNRMFVTVFHACGVLGAANEGMLHFESMSKEYGIVPAMEHYVGIVDMLGEAGHLDEALEYIEMLPFEPSICAWEVLMNHCRVHGNVNLGDRCAEIVEGIDSSRLTHESKSGLVPVKASDLVVKKENKKSKPSGGRSMYEYRAGDRSHPQRDKIYTQIHRMAAQMREAGYVPETRFVLHDVDQESKEEALLYHSEKLATAFSLITTPARSQIRIIKNLRICVDCHNALKIVSKLTGRLFIVRDVKRFHHMQDGVCSCNDYW